MAMTYAPSHLQFLRRLYRFGFLHPLSGRNFWYPPPHHPITVPNYRTFQCAVPKGITFTKGLEFFKIVADLAESEGHHPDLHLVGWNNVTIEIWTHAVGGLTENDFILAAKIDKLNVNDLLRRKPSD
ncbi:hypothetical protein AHAS_Ahas20G0337900 [Arachis hypogaea]